MSDVLQKDADGYAREIFCVFQELKKIIPDVTNCVGATIPDWIRLVAGETATIRDHVLLKYLELQQGRKTDMGVVCEVSQDISSNIKASDVDHYFAQDKMMENLEKLEKSQPLLRKIKGILKSTYKLDEDALNKLIPSVEKTLTVTGLRNVYYNYPENLWPMAGSTNRAKGKSESITFVVARTFVTMERMQGAEYAANIAKQMAEDFHISGDATPYEMSFAISKDFVEKSKGKCELKETTNKKGSKEITVESNKCIIPHFFDDNGRLVSQLSHFKQTTISKEAVKTSNVVARTASRAIAAVRAVSANPGFQRVARKLFGAVEKQARGDSVSDLSPNSMTSDDMLKFNATMIRMHKIAARQTTTAATHAVPSLFAHRLSEFEQRYLLELKINTLENSAQAEMYSMMSGESNVRGVMFNKFCQERYEMLSKPTEAPKRKEDTPELGDKRTKAKR